MGLTTFFGWEGIGLLALIVSKLNALQQEVQRLRQSSHAVARDAFQ